MKPTENKGNLTMKDLESLVGKNPTFSLKESTYGRKILKRENDTIGTFNSCDYGLSFRTKNVTSRITTQEQLEQIFAGTFVIEKKPDVIVTQTTTTNQQAPVISSNNFKHLIPQDFSYFERKVESGFTDMEEFEESMKKSENVLLKGPTGSGKTALVRKYCATHKIPYKRIPLNGSATVEDLVGHYIFKGMETIWVDGILTTAMKNGFVVAIDEINAASPEILFVLNPVLDDERCLILSSKEGEVILPNPNFRVIACCNPTEEGYSGTTEMNQALTDRFHKTLYIDYNSKCEKKILKQMSLNEDEVKMIQDFTDRVREAYSRNEIMTPFSTRSVINFAKLFKENREKLILNRFANSERTVINDILDVMIRQKEMKTASTTTGV